MEKKTERTQRTWELDETTGDFTVKYPNGETFSLNIFDILTKEIWNTLPQPARTFLEYGIKQLLSDRNNGKFASNTDQWFAMLITLKNVIEGKVSARGEKLTVDSVLEKLNDIIAMPDGNEKNEALKLYQQALNKKAEQLKKRKENRKES
jgi:hypothetical protein